MFSTMVKCLYLLVYLPSLLNTMPVGIASSLWVPTPIPCLSVCCAGLTPADSESLVLDDVWLLKVSFWVCIWLGD